MRRADLYSEPLTARTGNGAIDPVDTHRFTNALTTIHISDFGDEADLEDANTLPRFYLETPDANGNWIGYLGNPIGGAFNPFGYAGTPVLPLVFAVDVQYASLSFLGAYLRVRWEIVAGTCTFQVSIQGLAS